MKTWLSSNNLRNLVPLMILRAMLSLFLHFPVLLTQMWPLQILTGFKFLLAWSSRESWRSASGALGPGAGRLVVFKRATALATLGLQTSRSVRYNLLLKVRRWR